MPYYERRYGQEIRQGGVLCDRCGFDKHHRPTREGDVRGAMLDEEMSGWTWDPTGDWCWAPLWSSAPRPCDGCRRDVNTQVAFYVIAAELKELAAA